MAEAHRQHLQKLCFICAEIIRNHAHDVMQIKSNVERICGVQIKPDINIYPDKMCHTCWRAMKHVLDCEEKGVGYKTTKIAHTWTPRSNECDTCDTVDRFRALGKKKKKSKRPGRPKKCTDDRVPHSDHNFRYPRPG